MSHIASIDSCLANVNEILLSDKKHFSITEFDADCQFESVANISNRITTALHFPPASVKDFVETGIGAGMSKVGFWCMMHVMLFRKLSLYWYMKMFVGYAIRYVISLHKRNV